MALAVSRQPLTAEAWVCTLISPCWICGGQSGNGTGFSPSYSVPPSISFDRGLIQVLSGGRATRFSEGISSVPRNVDENLDILYVSVNIFTDFYNNINL
jgi:hypothetical protein